MTGFWDWVLGRPQPGGRAPEHARGAGPGDLGEDEDGLANALRERDSARAAPGARRGPSPPCRPAVRSATASSHSRKEKTRSSTSTSVEGEWVAPELQRERPGLEGLPAAWAAGVGVLHRDRTIAI